MSGDKGLIIYGNGAMARVLYSYVRHSTRVVGFTVDDHCIAAGVVSLCGLPLRPFSQLARAWPPKEHDLIVTVGYVQMNGLRERKCAEVIELGYALYSYVHSSVIRHDDVSIGAGCMILDHVSIHPGSRVEDGVFISSNVNVGHDCNIESYSWINSGVAIAGGSTIGGGSFLGVNASVGHGVSIGRRNFIAANTFIGSNTLPNQVYLSEPGQRLKMRSLDFLNMTSERRP